MEYSLKIGCALILNKLVWWCMQCFELLASEMNLLSKQCPFILDKLVFGGGGGGEGEAGGFTKTVDHTRRAICGTRKPPTVVEVPLV